MNAVLASMETPHLLMIACENIQTFNDEVIYIFRKLFNILKQKNPMKIILTTQSDYIIDDFIQQIATETFGEGFIAIYQHLTWGELTATSKRNILEKTVTFQGSMIALNQLTSAESMTASFPLLTCYKKMSLKSVKNRHCLLRVVKTKSTLSIEILIKTSLLDRILQEMK